MNRICRDLGAVVFAGALFLSLSASAEVAGIILGRVTVTDTRAVGQRFPGSLNPPVPGGGNPVVRVPEVGVRITPLPAAPGQLVEATTVRTDNTGFFIAPFVDPTRTGVNTVPVLFEVVWKRPDLEEFEVWRSLDAVPAVFEIEGFGLDASAPQLTTGRRIEAPVGAAGLLFFNPVLPASEASNAYLTTVEFFQRVLRGANGGAPSPLLEERLRGLEVRLGVFDNFGVGRGGLTPRSDLVFVWGTAPTANPFTVAHELGHAFAWNAFGLSGPGIHATVKLSHYCKDPGEIASQVVVATITQGAVCPFDLDSPATLGLCPCSHQFTSDEWEGPAWAEGLAHAIGANWLWARTGAMVPNPLPAGEAAPEVILPRALASGRLIRLEDSAACTEALLQGQLHGIEACQAMALWDLIDGPPLPVGDDDEVIAQSQFEIGRILGTYPRCIADRCLSETGVNARNHHDFAFHWTNFHTAAGAPAVASAIEDIYNQNGVGGGTP